MVLWCGHAVLPFPSFGLVFLFHLLVQVALVLVGDILWASSSVTCSFSCVCIGSFGCGYGCHALGWIFCGRFSFLPFRLDLSGLGVGVPSQSLEFLVLLV